MKVNFSLAICVLLAASLANPSFAQNQKSLRSTVESPTTADLTFQQMETAVISGIETSNLAERFRPNPLDKPAPFECTPFNISEEDFSRITYDILPVYTLTEEQLKNYSEGDELSGLFQFTDSIGIAVAKLDNEAIFFFNFFKNADGTYSYTTPVDQTKAKEMCDKLCEFYGSTDVKNWLMLNLGDSHLAYYPAYFKNNSLVVLDNNLSGSLTKNDLNLRIARQLEIKEQNKNSDVYYIN